MGSVAIREPQTLGAVGSQPDGSEGGFDGVGRP